MAKTPFGGDGYAASWNLRWPSEPNRCMSSLASCCASDRASAPSRDSPATKVARPAGPLSRYSSAVRVSNSVRTVSSCRAILVSLAKVHLLELVDEPHEPVEGLLMHAGLRGLDAREHLLAERRR